MDIWLLKLDSAGDTSWARTYGGPSLDQAYDVKQTSHGDYIISGCVAESTGPQACLTRVKEDGDLLWTREYGLGVAYSVQPTSDGGFIAGGENQTSMRGDFWLIKVDADGDTEWTRTYGGTDDDLGWSVQQASDGGYVLVGQTQSFGAGWWDVMLWKVDAEGNTLWVRTYGGPRYEVGFWDCLDRTSDGGYAIVALTGSFGVGGDAWLIRTDENGDSLWSRLYGGELNDGGYSVHQTLDGGFIVAGTTGSLAPADSNDLWLVRTSSTGELLWQGAYGGRRAEEGFCVTQTRDSGYVATGWTASFGAGGADVYVVKVKEPPVGVAEQPTAYASRPAPNATIVRGVLSLPQASGVKRGASSVLLDISGCKVLDLVHGTNDVSQLAPGVYFVREEPQAASPELRAVWKVVVTR